MSEARQLISRISELTAIIESKYPELYKYLDERPVTLPRIEKPVIDNSALEDYLRSLELLLMNHQRYHS